MKAINEFAPHTRRKESTFRQMIEFFICVASLWIAAIIFYFVKRGALEGSMVIVNGVVSMVFAVLADVLYNLPLLFDKKFEGDRFKEYIYRIVHSYSFVSGLILTLLCTVGIKWWELALTSFISILVMKLVFGGFGKNILNPAVFGRVFVQLAFTSDLKTYVSVRPDPFTITTGASATGLSNGVSSLHELGLLNTIVGNYFGSLGETFAILLIVICVYLSVRKIIDWRVPVFYVVPLYISFLIMFLAMGDKANSFADALSYTLVGGILFGGVICLTDPVTSSTSRSGRVIFALLAALLTLVIRTFARSHEGVAYSIIIVNFFVPLIDKIIKGRTRKNLVPIIVASSLAVVIVVVALSYGLTNPIDSVSGQFIEKSLCTIKEAF